MSENHLKSSRIMDVADICYIRKDAGLQCNTCIFFDEQKKKCRYEQQLTELRRGKFKVT